MAENLARLDVHVTLLFAVGENAFGQDMWECTAGSGVNMTEAILSLKHHSEV